MSLAIEFATAMAALGPFERSPTLTVAVSGGADSMALAILARDWVLMRNGRVIALVVDHGLRPGSAAEARTTVERLAKLDIFPNLLPLTGLHHGTALAARARIMRYHALTQACHEAGALHLLLGHHAADQVETLMMRVLGGSHTHGLAAMSAIRESASVRLLRPLLTIHPTRLRAFLRERGIAWIEDPSNQNPAATRSRLRPRIPSNAPDDLIPAIARAAHLRALEETATAAELAARASIRREGFAVLSPGRISEPALSRLIRAIGGLRYPPGSGQIADIAAAPGPATVAGVRLMPAGRLGDGWLILREEAAIARPVELAPGTLWDNRFRITGDTADPATVGKLGDDAQRFRDRDLPAAVLRSLPAIRTGTTLAAVPHLGYAPQARNAAIEALFAPPEPVAGPCFAPPRVSLG